MQSPPPFDRHIVRRYGLFVVGALVWGLSLSMGCSVKKNDATTRFYHNLTTRYNTYFNGRNAYEQGYRDLLQSTTESYSERLIPEPHPQPAQNESSEKLSGPFGKAIEKGRKAIREHSIRSKPKMDRRELVNNPKKKAFYDQGEFNSFVHNAWSLVGRGQFYSGQYTEAMATFAYMARLYASDPVLRSEARLWQARCYTALGWLDEAHEILEALPDDPVVQHKNPEISLAKGELLLLSERPVEAIGELRKAVHHAPERLQRARLYYLLGQLYYETGEYEAARKSFTKSISQSPPYPLEFAAQMRCIEIDARQQPTGAIRQLARLARKDKNKELLDQIYLTQGRLYLDQRDTVHALEAFTQGAERSTSRSFDFMLCQIHRGEIYLAQRNYLKAQEAYSAAAGVINSSHADYDKIRKLSADLDLVMSYAQQLYEQDSLRRVAAMPPEQQFALIDSLIEAHKKELKEQARQEVLAAQEEQNRSMNEEANMLGNEGFGQGAAVGRPPRGMSGVVGGEFYFNNPQLVAQGKDLFERKWGKRPLTDDWRRRNRTLTPEDMSPPTTTTEDSSRGSTDDESTTPDTLAADQDPTQRAYYLRRLPRTPEDIAASDEIIQTALEGMGNAFNEQMDRLEESCEAYQELLHRYPNYKHRASVFYTLYMLYHRLGHPDIASTWREKLLHLEPDDVLAQTLAQPDYIERLKRNVGADERLYERAFDAYLSGDARTVQSLYRSVQSDYPLSETLPHFSFLQALSFVLQGDEAGFRSQLEALLSSYPQAVVSVLAQEMLQHLKRGRHIARGGYSGMKWDQIILSTDTIETQWRDTPYQVEDPHEPHYALLYYPHSGTAEINTLRFAIESFNFSTFTDYILPVTIVPQEEGLVASINGFPNATVAWKYAAEAYSPKGYLSQLDSSALLLILSEGNFNKLTHGGQTVGDYMQFAIDSIVEHYPAALMMIDRWQATMTQMGHSSQGTTSDTILTPLPPTSPITFDINRSKGGLDSLQIEPIDSVAIPHSSEPPTTQVNKPRRLTPNEMKELERERMIKEREARKAREQQLKEREEKRRTELKAREEERKRQIKAREEERKRIESERSKQQKEREKQRKTNAEKQEKARREFNARHQ